MGTLRLLHVPLYYTASCAGAHRSIAGVVDVFPLKATVHKASERVVGQSEVTLRAKSREVLSECGFCPSALLYLLGIRQIRRREYFLKSQVGTPRFTPFFLKSDTDGQINEGRTGKFQKVQGFALELPARHHER
jgi:hypothetical protein